MWWSVVERRKCRVERRDATTRTTVDCGWRESVHSVSVLEAGLSTTHCVALIWLLVCLMPVPLRRAAPRLSWHLPQLKVQVPGLASPSTKIWKLEYKVPDPVRDVAVDGFLCMVQHAVETYFDRAVTLCTISCQLPLPPRQAHNKDEELYWCRGNFALRK